MIDLKHYYIGWFEKYDFDKWHTLYMNYTNIHVLDRAPLPRIG